MKCSTPTASLGGARSASHRNSARRRVPPAAAVRGARAPPHGHYLQRLRRSGWNRADLSVRSGATDRRSGGMELIERGLKQRIRALNLFIDDVYHEQRIIKDGVVPAEILRTATSFRRRAGLDPPRGIWCHITGTDLVRDGDGQIYVLEDNLRCPSGVSCVLLNRLIIKRTFRSCSNPIESARWTTTRAVCATPSSLSCRGRRDAARGSDAGAGRSAYFEHSFLAQQMGVELVEGAISSPRTASCGCARPGLRARRRDLPAPRRRLPRPEGLSSGLDAGCGAVRRLQGRPGRARTPRGAASPTTRSSTRMRSGDRQILSGRGDPHPERADLPLCRRGAAALRVGESAGARRQGRQRVRATACSSDRARRATSARSSPGASKRRRATTSRSQRWRSRACRRSSTARFTSATWISGHTFSTVRISSSCPAA